MKINFLFNKLVRSVYAVKKITLEEICKRTIGYSYSGIQSIKRTLQVKHSRLKEKKREFQAFILIPAGNRAPVSGVTDGDKFRNKTSRLKKIIK